MEFGLKSAISIALIVLYNDMIISASRRTDIPAFYSDAFFKSIEDGFIEVVNPMNAAQIRRVDLSPSSVDGIVFWTKNPRPMLSSLNKLDGYNFYFQFTLNPYDSDVEGGLPPKEEIIDTFLCLSKIIGKEKIVWRYDPVLLNKKYNIDYHTAQFEKYAEILKGSAQRCVFSFLDYYKKIDKKLRLLEIEKITDEQKKEIAKSFSIAAQKNGFSLSTCAEKDDFSEYGIERGRCIDGALIEKLRGMPPLAAKNSKLRPYCLCHSSVDIGRYNTCRHKCAYCYASF